VRLRDISSSYPPIHFKERPIYWVNGACFDDDEANGVFRGRIMEIQHFKHGHHPLYLTPDGKLKGGAFGNDAVETLRRASMGKDPVPIDALENCFLDLDAMIGVDPSIIRGSPRLQQLIAQSLRYHAWHKIPTWESAESLLGLMSWETRCAMMQDDDVIRKLSSRKRKEWEVTGILDALHDMTAEQFDQASGVSRQDVPWAPVALQREFLRGFLRDCMGSSDPARALTTTTLPRCIQSAAAWTPEIVGPGEVELIVGAFRQNRESANLWRILRYVPVEALASLYVEELQAALVGRYAGDDERGTMLCERSLLALGALSTATVRRHWGLIRECLIYYSPWMEDVKMYICLRHMMEGPECTVIMSMEHLVYLPNDDQERLLRLGMSEVNLSQSWNHEADRAVFFNMDPGFIAETLVRVADRYATMTLNDVPWPFSDQLAVLEWMPRSLLERVAGHRLARNGRTLAEEMVSRATPMGHIYTPFLERLLWLDQHYVGGPIARAFIAAWRGLLEEEGEDVLQRTLLLWVEMRFC
jgi:hypothetical protein